MTEHEILYVIVSLLIIPFLPVILLVVGLYTVARILVGPVFGV